MQQPLQVAVQQQKDQVIKMKTKVILHGKISRKFQKEFEFFNVKNLKTVISAIDSIHPNFKNSLLQDARQGINYQILIDRKITKNLKAV